MREWKPGDVAMVTNRFGVDNVAICSLVAGYVGYVWKFGVADDWERAVGVQASAARPLVVIDPEAVDQVVRFRDALNAAMYADDYVSVGDIQAALREFASPKPSKPEEPLGLGAVVEDAEGRRWVRDTEVGANNWLCSPSGVPPKRWRYISIDVVRVLSEGVTP